MPFDQTDLKHCYESVTPSTHQADWSVLFRHAYFMKLVQMDEAILEGSNFQLCFTQRRKITYLVLMYVYLSLHLLCHCSLCTTTIPKELDFYASIVRCSPRTSILERGLNKITHVGKECTSYIFTLICYHDHWQDDYFFPSSHPSFLSCWLALLLKEEQSCPLTPIILLVWLNTPDYLAFICQLWGLLPQL